MNATTAAKMPANSIAGIRCKTDRQRLAQGHGHTARSRVDPRDQRRVEHDGDDRHREIPSPIVPTRFELNPLRTT